MFYYFFRLFFNLKQSFETFDTWLFASFSLKVVQLANKYWPVVELVLVTYLNKYLPCKLKRKNFCCALISCSMHREIFKYCLWNQSRPQSIMTFITLATEMNVISFIELYSKTKKRQLGFLVVFSLVFKKR